MPVAIRGAALEWLEKTYGGYIREQEDTATVTTPSSVILPRDPERVALTVINLGTDPVYLSPRPQGVVPQGIRLSPSGGWMSVNLMDDAALPTVEWNGISGGAPSTVFFITVRRDTRTVVAKE